MKINLQREFWKGDFGKEYSLRNTYNTLEEWDKVHLETWGITKTEMYKKILKNLPCNLKILEVGCNTGMQLSTLQGLGFKHLYGLELQAQAVSIAKKRLRNVEIINANAFDIPYKDSEFDLVFTSGVLIHIHPNRIKRVMSEMYRCSRQYILGFEYFSNSITEIKYRNHNNVLWKSDYCSLFIKHFPELKLVKKQFYKYLKNDNQDCMFLLEKNN